MTKYNLNTDFRSERPPSVPPNITPLYCKSAMKPTKEMLSAYIKTYVYVWLVNGGSFWMYPQRMCEDMLCGLIWSGESWEPACFSVNLIRSIY